MTVRDPRAIALGKSLADLRRAKGLHRKEVVERLSTYYSDVSSYGRVEQGSRFPERDTLLAIIVRGFEVKDLETINKVLLLGDYEGFTQADAKRYTLDVPQNSSAMPLSRPQAIRVPDWISSRTAIGALGTSLAISCWIAFQVENHAAISLTIGLLYAGLYVVSLLLESAFLPDRVDLWAAGFLLFSFGLITSVAGAGIDAAMVSTRNPLALAVSVGIVMAAAAIQWIALRPVLPEFQMAQAKFRLLSSQAAHLKNTGYFLFLAIVFWLTPFHAILILERESRAEQLPFVQGVLSRQIMIGRGMVALNGATLLIVLAVVIAMSIKMGSHLLDDMKPHPRLSYFTVLFYLRAFLYFLLAAICVGWYLYSLSQWS